LLVLIRLPQGAMSGMGDRFLIQTKISTSQATNASSIKIPSFDSFLLTFANKYGLIQYRKPKVDPLDF